MSARLFTLHAVCLSAVLCNLSPRGSGSAWIAALTTSAGNGAGRTALMATGSSV